MTITARTLPPPDLEYPETDGKPMAENTIQYRYITLIKGGLDVVFRHRDDVFIAGDLFWYPVEGEPETSTAPDVLVALGRPKGDRRSYQQWKEACGGVYTITVAQMLQAGEITFNSGFGCQVQDEQISAR